MPTNNPPSSPGSTGSGPKSKDELTLEVVTANQREINGSLYQALDLILDYIGSATVTGGDPATLDRARAIIENIPGFDPPGCGAGPYP